MRYGRNDRPWIRRKPVLPVVLAILLTAVLAIGTTAAILMYKTDPVTNDFQAGTVGCKIAETVSGNQKTAIAVKNAGDVATYVRIRLVSYWTNSEGQILGKSSPALDFTPGSGWFLWGPNTYYYAAPVAAGTESGNLLATPLTMEKDSSGNVQVIEVLAECIQCQPSEAVEEAWPVIVGADGLIGGVSE